MNIILTGYNGFLGRNILNYLSTDTKNVFFHLRYPCEIKNSTLYLLRNEIIEFDADCVIFIGWSGANSYLKINNKNQFDENIPGLFQFLDIFKKRKPIKFIGFGSCSEYGSVYNTDDGIDVEKPSSLYGISKFLLKMYLEHFCFYNKHSFLWIRPTLVYGNGDVCSRLIPRTIAACNENRKIILDDCEIFCDPIYIKDFVFAVCNLIYHNASGVYNIGYGEKIKIKNIVEIVKKIFNKNDDIIEYDKRLNREIRENICPNTTKYKSFLNWHPKYNIFDGLLDYISSPSLIS